MGGACSRKRDQQVDEECVNRGVSGRYCKSGSFKWLGNSFSRLAINNDLGKPRCPSLMELCIHKICEVYNACVTDTRDGVLIRRYSIYS